MIDNLKITIYIISLILGILLNTLIYVSIDYYKQEKKIKSCEKINARLQKEINQEKTRKKIKPCNGIYEDKKVEKCYIEFD